MPAARGGRRLPRDHPHLPAAGQGAAFLSAVLQSGSLYPAAALALVLPIFLPVAVAVVAGDAVAGESTQGTLRYLLVRPVRRTALLGEAVVDQVFVVVAVLRSPSPRTSSGSILIRPERLGAHHHHGVRYIAQPASSPSARA